MNKTKHRFSVSFSFIVLVFATLACGSGEVETKYPVATIVSQTSEAVPDATASQISGTPTIAPEAVQPTRRLELTHTPRPTPTNTPEPTSTQTPTKELEAVADLKEEIYFMGGGAGSPFCEQLPQDEDIPTIRAGCHPKMDFCGLCVFGFPLAGDIDVDVYAPNGNLTASIVVRIGEDPDQRQITQIDPAVEESQIQSAVAGLPVVGSANEINGIPVMDIAFYRPAGLPTGEWYAVVDSANAHVEGPFLIEAHQIPAVSVLPNTDINPFEFTSQDSYSAGDEIVVLGTNFEPGKNLPLGTYYATGEWGPDGGVASLVRGKAVTTDDQGNFQILVRVELSDIPGTYCVVGVSDPDVSGYIDFGYGNTACYKVVR